MGTPKALLPFAGATLVEHIAMCHSGCGPTVVVVGGTHAAAITEALSTRRLAFVSVVPNPDPKRGMLSSLQVGIKAALRSGATHVVFCPVDVPLRSVATVEAVARSASSADVVVASFEGRDGHPARLSPAAIATVLAAAPTDVLRDVLSGLSRASVGVDDRGVVTNWNIPADVVTADGKDVG